MQSASNPTTKWSRFAALGGIGFVLLAVIATFASGGSRPAIDDSTATIAKFYVQHHTGELISDFLSVAASFPLLFFLAALWHALRQAERSGVAAVAGVLGIVLGGALINASFLADSALAFKAVKLAYNPATGAVAEPVAIRALFEFTHLARAFVWFPIAVTIVTTSLVALQTGFLPRWLGAGGLIVSLVMLVSTFAVFTDSQNLLVFLVFVAFILFLVWILTTSILLYRRGRGAAIP